MEPLDNKIKKIMKSEIEIPKSIGNVIEHALYKDKKTKYREMKVAIMICVIVLIGTGGSIWAIINNEVVNNIYKDIQKLFISESMKDMMQNGYMYNESTEFVYDKDIGIRIKDIVMSDHDLQFFMDIQSDRKNVKSLRAENLFIYDENHNILLCYYRKQYEQFCKKNKLTIEESIPVLANGGYSINPIIQEEYYKEDMFAIRSENGLPKSKKLFMEIGWMKDEKTDRIIKGNWKFEIELPERFWQRESYSYRVEENNNFELLQANVSQTQMKLAIKEKQDGFDIKNAFITTEKGKKIYISQHQGNIISIKDEGDILVRFDINTDIATDFMTITGNDREGKEVSYQLTRENK